LIDLPMNLSVMVLPADRYSPEVERAGLHMSARCPTIKPDSPTQGDS
jgi:hypothetical protein